MIESHSSHPNRERAIIILPNLVHPNSPRFSNSNHDDTGFFILWRRLRWRRGGWVLGVLEDPDVGDIRFRD